MHRDLTFIVNVTLWEKLNHTNSCVYSLLLFKILAINNSFSKTILVIKKKLVDQLTKTKFELLQQNVCFWKRFIHDFESAFFNWF